MIELRHVVLRYPNAERPALQDISFKVQRGEFVALLGPSGAGKSTIIRAVNGLVKPDGGAISVDGTEVTALTGPELQAARRKVAIVFQEFHLIDRLSVLVNVLSGRFGSYPFWRTALRLWHSQDETDARRVLERVGLHEYESHLARELSGGQRQRVAIARAMMQQPLVLLGDEPVSSLDPVTARSVLQLLRELSAEQGLTTVLSLHDVTLAQAFCDRAIGVNGGQIVYDGPMAGVTGDVLANLYGNHVRAGK